MEPLHVREMLLMLDCC